MGPGSHGPGKLWGREVMGPGSYGPGKLWAREVMGPGSYGPGKLWALPGAALAGLAAVLCGPALPFAPVVVSTPTVTWPRRSGAAGVDAAAAHGLPPARARRPVRLRRRPAPPPSRTPATAGVGAPCWPPHLVRVADVDRPVQRRPDQPDAPF